MATEPDSGLTCDDCGGTPDACICDALERVLAEAPTPPETTHGYDRLAWLQTAVRESNEGVDP